LPLSTSKRHTAAIQVQLHLFLTSAGNLPSRLLYRRYLLHKRPSGPHNPSGCSEEEENLVPLSVIKPRLLVAVVPPGFIFKNSMFCPKSVLMCFVRTLEYKTIAPDNISVFCYTRHGLILIVIMSP